MTEGMDLTSTSGFTQGGDSVISTICRTISSQGEADYHFPQSRELQKSRMDGFGISWRPLQILKPVAGNMTGMHCTGCSSSCDI